VAICIAVVFFLLGAGKTVFSFFFDGGRIRSFVKKKLSSATTRPSQPLLRFHEVAPTSRENGDVVEEEAF
jgi:hypothetical protein